jgi:hypothetical protein
VGNLRARGRGAEVRGKADWAMSLRIGGKKAFAFTPIHKFHAVGFILQKLVPKHRDCGRTTWLSK